MIVCVTVLAVVGLVASAFAATFSRTEFAVLVSIVIPAADGEIENVLAPVPRPAK